MNTTIGERIKTLREWKNLSSTELARISHCTTVQLSQYEASTRLPTLRHFYWICKSLGVSFEVVLENSDIIRNDDKDNKESDKSE